MYIIPAERILSSSVSRLWLSLNRRLSLRLSLTHSPSRSLILSLNLCSSLSLRIGLSLIMIVKETERAEEKKEKQNKKQKQIIKRRNERKPLNWTAPMSRKCLRDVPCCLFFVDFDPKSSGAERRRYRNEGLGGFWGPSASR